MWHSPKRPESSLEAAIEKMNEAEAFFDWHYGFNREADVSTAARAVANAMATSVYSEQLIVEVTIEEVADFTNLSTRSVIRAINELDASGWVTRLYRGEAGRRSEYALTIPVAP